jgi:hypothetical protein
MHRTQNHRNPIVASILALLASSASAKADVLFQAPTAATSALRDWGNPNFTDSPIINSFVLSQDSTVTDVTVAFLISPFAPISINWAIYANTSLHSTQAATPSSYVYDPNLISSYGFDFVKDITFSVGSLALTAGTYFLQIDRPTASEAIYWATSPSTAARAYTYDIGNYLPYDLYAGFSPPLNDVGANAFAILGTTDATSAPEPASAVLLLGGLAGLVTIRRGRTAGAHTASLSRSAIARPAE